jgi:hypothetical protein
MWHIYTMHNSNTANRQDVPIMYSMLLQHAESKGPDTKAGPTMMATDCSTHQGRAVQQLQRTADRLQDMPNVVRFTVSQGGVSIGLYLAVCILLCEHNPSRNSHCRPVCSMTNRIAHYMNHSLGIQGQVVKAVCSTQRRLCDTEHDHSTFTAVCPTQSKLCATLSQGHHQTTERAGVFRMSKSTCCLVPKISPQCKLLNKQVSRVASTTAVGVECQKRVDTRHQRGPDSKPATRHTVHYHYQHTFVPDSLLELESGCSPPPSLITHICDDDVM